MWEIKQRNLGEFSSNLYQGLTVTLSAHARRGLLRRKKKEECQISIFYFAQRACQLRCYGDVIHTFD